MRVFGEDLPEEKHSRLLQPRDAWRNVITWRLLHIAKPADMLLFAAPPLLLCSAICLGCCPPVVLMRVFSASLCYFCHTYKEGAHGGGDACLDFLLSVCFYTAVLLVVLIFFVRYWLCITDARGIFFHEFLSARVHFILFTSDRSHLTS